MPSKRQWVTVPAAMLLYFFVLLLYKCGMRSRNDAAHSFYCSAARHTRRVWLRLLTGEDAGHAAAACSVVILTELSLQFGLSCGRRQVGVTELPEQQGWRRREILQKHTEIRTFLFLGKTQTYLFLQQQYYEMPETAVMWLQPISSLRPIGGLRKWSRKPCYCLNNILSITTSI